MAAQHRIRGGPAAALPSFSLLSLNVARQATLGGLAVLLDQLPQLPTVIFLQEVAMAADLLQAAAQRLGFESHVSPSPQDFSRRLVLLYRAAEVPAITDFTPGFAQLVTFSSVSFLHVHAPSGAHNSAARDNFFRVDVADAIAALPSPPLLIGDFNCVLRLADTAGNFRNKRCPPLADLVAAFGLTDGFPYLHPNIQSFTFFRRNTPGSRLDRAYIPPQLLPHLLAVTHPPSLSDHSALYVQLAGVLQVAQPPPIPTTYWKLNTSLLKEEDFLPAFTAMWMALEAARPGGACPATWWEETAKPACRAFCINFSRMVAHRRRELANLLLAGLQVALLANDWPAVTALKSRLHRLASYRLAGRAVRAGMARGPETAATVFQIAAEAAKPPVGPLHVSAGGQVLTEPAEVEEEIHNYFEALFQGRHVATVARPEPHDSGQPFAPDFTHLPEFLQDIRVMDRVQSESLDMPVDLQELQQAIAAAASGKAPGLDGLPYEFYASVLHLVGGSLVEALNVMLERGALSASLQRGAVRLLPKVPGAPEASQLRPITLLSCDYKLLTKVFVRRLLPILPTILTTHQLCSVPGRSIFDGCVALLSAVEACHRGRRPGFILNLDFFHAFDRVCLPYLDCVLEAMGFGITFRAVVATLHDGATATFLLQTLSREIPVEFSVRQGDPLAALLFNIQMEPFLSVLHRLLPGLPVGDILELVEAYMDDVDAMGERLEDIIAIDGVTRRFEALSGQILNRNRKSAILGLGAWAGRQDWPLPWLHAPPTLKVFGVTLAPTLEATMAASWAACTRGVTAALNFWASRRIPTLRLRRDALETFALSKLWYLCQILPMPSQVAQQLTTAAGAFLWRGHLERLAWQELHCPALDGGLGVSSITTRAQALLSKQFCWAVAQEGEAAAHWAYWVGPLLQDYLPDLAAGRHAPVVPPPWRGLVEVLLELFQFETVSPEALAAATSREIYAAFMDTPPPPKVTVRRPELPWATIWARLWGPRAAREEADTQFQLIHNILPARGRLARFGVEAAGHCPRCPGVIEDLVHIFTRCPRVAAVWQQLVASLVAATGPVPDEDLLLLAWPPTARDGDIATAIMVFVHLVWTTRGEGRPPTFERLTVALRAKPAPFTPLW